MNSEVGSQGDVGAKALAPGPADLTCSRVLAPWKEKKWVRLGAH